MILMFSIVTAIPQSRDFLAFCCDEGRIGGAQMNLERESESLIAS